ncbi:TPA: hypothetical protein IAA87_03960 [Candidatus Avigastranaerophilus faecigallinarum]|nr:hypothetical protein [Candidatus Avigastranaerophilus faecigallinarum]
MKKKIIAIFILLGISFSDGLLMVQAQEPFKGYIEETDLKNKENDKIFTKEKEKLEGNKVVELTVSQVLAGTTSVEGDEFFAEVSEDVLAGSGVLLPKGTVAHGIIRNIVDPKRMGRDGYIELSFDYLITPDGREIPIQGEMTSKLHPAKSVAKVAGENIAYTAVGGVTGAMAALEIAGIPGAVASQGYTLAGGAAIGGLIALGMSFFRKGSDVLISPGDEIKVKIVSSEPIQVMTHEAVRQDELEYEGLEVDISDVFLEKDPFDHLNTISLDLIIKNNSKSDFSSFDIELVNDLHNSYHPSIFSDYKNSLAMKTIKKGENVSGILSFSVDNPNRQHWLVFYDRRTHKPLAKISIDNAIKDLKITDLTEKRKKRKKVF